jgi:predicted DCC family thiol-disulfide oxidoreductase YuxK
MEHPILLFDGVCNLCNGFVQTVIKIDRKAQFKFAALQSDMGIALLEQHQLPTQHLNTVVLLYRGKYYTHSDVALEIAYILGGIWTVFYIAKAIPKPIRDAVYNWIAKNRYRWFGKQETCWLPTPELKQRFL